MDFLYVFVISRKFCGLFFFIKRRSYGHLKHVVKDQQQRRVFFFLPLFVSINVMPYCQKKVMLIFFTCSGLVKG